MMTLRLVLAALAPILLVLAGCSAGSPRAEPPAARGAQAAAGDDAKEQADMTPQKTEIATFGAGCFWCVEAVFARLDGVEDASSGYMGGATENPTYRDICTGRTGHAEVVQVTFDPSVIAYEELLDWFWKLHDPTTLNRQGPDAGTQYRSAIFYHSEEQRKTAEASRARADSSGDFSAPIVTEITAASTYYEAEPYHQDYYESNASQPYCRTLITPKLDKLGLKE